MQQGADRTIRVLHAEDDPAFRELVAELLDERSEIEPVSAPTPAAALDRLEAERFDCVVSDYDGDEPGSFRPVIEATEDGPPCVLLTGTERERVDAAVSAAVDDYLRKGAGDGIGRLVERIRRHAERYRSAERYRALFEEAAGPMVIHDAGTGRVIDANSQYASLLGYDREVASELGLSDLVPGEEPYTEARARERLAAAAAGEPQTFEWENVTADGDRLPVEVTLERMTVVGDARVLATVRGIRDRKRREAALERHKSHLERLHLAADRLLGVEDREAVYDAVVDAAESVLDPEFSALVVREGSRLTPVAVGGDADDADALSPSAGPEWAAIETGETQSYETGAGRVLCVPLERHGVLCLRGCGPGPDHALELAETLASHAAVALDRADREAKLRERSRRRDSLAAAFPDYVFFLDEEGTYREVWLATQHEDWGGHPEPDLLGATIGDYLGDEAASTLVGVIDDALATGEVQEVEYAVEIEGETLWLEAHVAPLPADGDSEVVVVARDITTQRQYEQRLEAQNERLDEFASMVSHDLRNPLNVVQGRLELIDSAAGDPEAVQGHVDDARNAAQRMADLIEDMLTVARTEQRSLTVGPVSLGEAARRAWGAVSASDAALSVDAADCRIRADEGELIRLLENLFRNSVEHGSTGSRTPSGDSVEHGSTSSRPEADDLSVTVERIDGGFAVADDGDGIPERHRDRVFESGYSTASDGTGYGLDIVERVVAAHGWSIELADGDGGARFEITGVEVDDGASAGSGTTDRDAA